VFEHWFGHWAPLIRFFYLLVITQPSVISAIALLSSQFACLLRSSLATELLNGGTTCGLLWVSAMSLY